MFDKFFPDEYMDSTYEIDFAGLYKKGIRGLLFDIDNTLVPHGKPSVRKAERLFEQLRSLGFKTCLISNNKEPRVKAFAKKLESPYISNAHKPLVKNYQKALDLMGTKAGNTVFIGDQLFTDVYGAKRSGIYSILVRPIHPREEIQIILKRYLEKIVLYFYEKQKKDNL